MPYLGEDDYNLKLKNIINNSISGTSKPYNLEKEYHKQLYNEKITSVFISTTGAHKNTSSLIFLFS